jgi:acylpyruvate hydrolase
VRLVTFQAHGSAHLGAQSGDHIVDLPEAYAALLRSGAAGADAELPTLPPTLLELLAAGDRAMRAARAALTYASEPQNLDALARLGLATPVEQTNFLPPVPRPGKIICLGRNYRAHAEELGNQPPDYPVLFAKFANALVGHQHPIVLPAVSTQVDYEAELGVVIGRRGKAIPREKAMDYVAGYTPFNDISVRDFQRRTVQWLQGKTFDSTGPVGPALVTFDEIADPHALDITLRLNGEVMQHSNTNQMIFDVPTIISYISQILTLEPGDLIATGTPSGVGAGRDPQVWLTPDDVVQVEIAQVGVLENRVEAPEAGEADAPRSA